MSHAWSGKKFVERDWAKEMDAYRPLASMSLQDKEQALKVIGERVAIVAASFYREVPGVDHPALMVLFQKTLDDDPVIFPAQPMMQDAAGKVALAITMRNFAQKGVGIVLLMHEAWMVTRNLSNQELDSGIINCYDQPAPSTQPDRKEAFSVVIYCANGLTGSILYVLDRDPITGTKRLGDVKVMLKAPENEKQKLFGRFFDLPPQPGQSVN